MMADVRLSAESMQSVPARADIFSELAAILSGGGVGDAPFEASLIVAEAARMRSDRQDADIRLSGAQRGRALDLARRRAEGEPMAYLLGKKEFMSMEFAVTSAVLVPRPETETLVEAVAAHLRRGSVFVDVGTGSANIACALLAAVPGAWCAAVDISMAALGVARANIERHGLASRCGLVCGDVLRPIAGGVDLIVSNPPYVAGSGFKDLPVEVREYEPRLALDGGEDGLDFYRRLADEAPRRLAPGGYVIVEVGFGQAEAVRGLFASAGLAVGETAKDLAGVERVVAARRD